MTVIRTDKVADQATREALEGIRDILAGSAAPVPVGTVLYTLIQPVDVEPPWFFCDGRAMPKQRWPRLYKAIGDMKTKPTDSSDEFRVPDLRDRVCFGVDTPNGNQVGFDDTDKLRKGDAGAVVTCAHLTPIVLAG